MNGAVRTEPSCRQRGLPCACGRAAVDAGEVCALCQRERDDAARARRRGPGAEAAARWAWAGLASG